MRAAALFLAACAATACQGAARALGPTPSDAQAHAHEILGALTGRFGPQRLDPAYAAARPKLARSSLVPSRVFDDASVWTDRRCAERILALAGRAEDDAYTLGPRLDAPAPRRCGDYRGTLRLRRLDAGEYEWSMRDELAIGSVSAGALADALTAVFRGAETMGAGDARSAARTALPRTAAALGRVLTLEELSVAPAPDGAVAVTVRVVLEPARLEREFPHYARFLQRNVVPLRFRARAADAGGSAWWELAAADGRATLRLRLHGGDLAPIDGPTRDLPSHLRVTVDLSTKSGLFRVGFSGLEAEAALVRDAHEKRVAAVFRRPPDWSLPFLVEPLLRGSLRRPFKGEGAFLAYSVSDAPGEPTLVGREYRLAVHESWVVRWLGGMVGGTVAEFRRDAEAEADTFTAQALRALEADVIALAASAKLSYVCGDGTKYASSFRANGGATILPAPPSRCMNGQRTRPPA